MTKIVATGKILYQAAKFLKGNTTFVADGLTMCSAAVIQVLHKEKPIGILMAHRGPQHRDEFIRNFKEAIKTISDDPGIDKNVVQFKVLDIQTAPSTDMSGAGLDLRSDELLIDEIKTVLSGRLLNSTELSRMTKQGVYESDIANKMEACMFEDGNIEVTPPGRSSRSGCTIS